MRARAATHLHGQPTVCLIVTAESTAMTFYSGYVEYLHRRGWIVYLVASSEGNLEQFAAGLHAIGISVPMRRDPSIFRDGVSLARLTYLLARLRPAVVVSATPKAGLLGGIASIFCRVPVRVYQLWGLRLETETGIRRKILSMFESLTARVATQVVANSPSLAARAEELGVNGGKNVVVLGPGSSHGVDIDRFSPTSSLDPVDKETRAFLASGRGLATLGFLGRIHADKGLDVLIESLRICAEMGVRVNVLIVGAVESGYLDQELVAAKSYARVHLAGEVDDPRPYLRAMDFLCLPSRREGFPNVVLEAAAMGLPAITSDATGAIDSVVDGETGIIFPVDNAPALAEAIQTLVGDTKLRRELGESAMKRARTSFRSEEIWRMQEENLRTQLTDVAGGPR